MIVLKDPTQLPLYDQPIVASLSEALVQRFQDLSGDESPHCHGYIVIVEPGDGVKALEEYTYCSISSFEYIYDDPLYYEMVFIFNDGGSAVLVFVPKVEGMDAELLNLCRDCA